MIKIFKPKIIATTIILAIIVLSSTYTSFMPNVQAEQVTNATAKGLAVIEQVAGFDLTKYITNTTLDTPGSYLDILPTETIRYSFTASHSHIEVQDTFTKGSLQIMDVLENSGSPCLTTYSQNVVSMAKDFLLSYQSYSANSFYGQLASMMTNVESNRNSTIINGNIKFVITTTSGLSPLGNSTTFTWSYASNGVDAACKCISLSYQNGFIKSYIDTWYLYKIGSTTVNLSEQQAGDIAVTNAKTFSWTVGSGNETYVINNFNVTKPVVKQLVFCEAGNVSNARSSDALTLFPMWRIGVGLDKYYPGDVYGIYVDVWADTGQVREIQELTSTFSPSASAEATIAESSLPTVNIQGPVVSAQINMSPALFVVFAACAIFTIYSVNVCLSRKKTQVHSLHSPKLRKISGSVLCLLISILALGVLTPVPTVSADCANIWGDTSSGSNQPPHNQPYLNDEAAISSYIKTTFQSCGYTSNNYVPYGQTTAYNVLSHTIR